MNEEELAALYDKLIANGLSEAEAIKHVQRAAIGGGRKEDATTPLEAGAMHAVEGLSMGLGGRPAKGSGYQGSEGGRQMLSPEARAKREISADEREIALAIAAQEHPVASKVGQYGTLALPGVGAGPRGLLAGGKALARGGKGLLQVAKDIALYPVNKATAAREAAKRAPVLTERLMAENVKQGARNVPMEGAAEVFGDDAERLVAERLGMDPAQLRGKVGTAKPATLSAEDATAIEGRRQAAKAARSPLSAAKEQLAPKSPRSKPPFMSDDQAAYYAEKKLNRPGARRVSPPKPTAKPTAPVPGNLKQMVKQARGIGMDEETIARRLFEEGLKPEQVTRALAGG